MRTKHLGLLPLMLLVLGWVLLLSSVPLFSRQSYSSTGIALTLLAPPLVVWLSGLALLALVKRSRRQAEQAEAARQAAEREAQRQAARTKYQREVSERRLSCDCRGLVVLGTASEKFEAVFPKLEQATLRKTPAHVPSAQDKNDISDTALQWRAMLVRALPSLYQQVPAAVLFPIYLLLPNDIVYRDEIACVEHLVKLQMQAFGATQATPPRMPPPTVIAMPNANPPTDNLIGIFEQTPELAGIVALIFDSPLSRSPSWEETESYKSPSQTHGQPQQGLIAMCLTNAKLGDIIGRIARFAPETHCESPELQPCWEKAEHPSGALSLLVPLEHEEREALLASEILAAIHRSASTEIAPTLRPAERAASYRSLLERTLFTSGQKAYPFDHGEFTSEEVDAESAPSAPTVGWLVHNSGTMTSPLAGSRLGALGTALHHAQLPLNLVEEASNLPHSLGDWGQAMPWAILASAIARTAEKQESTLMAVFADGNQIAMAMANTSPARYTLEQETKTSV